MANGLVAAYNAGKPAFVQTAITTLANVGAGNVAIYWGVNVSVHRQSEIVTRLKQCMDALNEAGFPSPTASQVMQAEVDIDHGKGQIAVASQATTTAPTETAVGVAYGETFDNVPHSSHNLKETVLRLIDDLKDDILSAA